MKYTKITAIIAATALLAGLVACSSNNGESIETEASASISTEITTETETEATTVVETAAPTGIPLNQDNYSEFSEPKMYNVISDTITYTDNSTQEQGQPLVAGAMVTGVATDGYYIILDSGLVVPAEALEEFG